MTACRKNLLTGTAAAAMLALAGTSAFAADAPRTYNPPPQQQPAPVAQQVPADWAGFYLGGHGGYAWGDADWTTATPGHDIDGGLGGIHGGYNWQSGNLVAGLEADISGGDVSGSSACVGTCSTELDYLGSVRGRLGWANEVFHIYATGGFAYAGGSVTDTVAGYSEDINPVGGVVGGGAEYKISDALSTRLEVLHYMFEDEDVNGGAENVELDATVARAGLTWHFNTY